MLSFHAVKILPDELIFPDLTALWENQLENVANNKISLDSFYQSQLSALNNFVQQIRDNFSESNLEILESTRT